MKKLRAFVWLGGLTIAASLGGVACSGDDTSDAGSAGDGGTGNAASAGDGGTGNAEPTGNGGAGDAADIDPALPLDEQLAAFAELTLDERETLVSHGLAKLERELFTVSGLEEELGGAEATDTQWAENLAALGAMVQELETYEPELSPASPKRRTAAKETGANLGAALFGGYLVSALLGKAALSASNDGTTGTSSSNGVELSLAVDQVTMRFSGSDTSSEGLTTELSSTTDLQACPNQNGTFLASTHLDMSATIAGGSGQTGKLEVRLSGTVDDDANVAGVDVDIDFQAGKFEGGAAEFFDHSVRFGMLGSETASSLTVNQQTDNVSAEFVTQSTSMAALMGALIAVQQVDAMKDALQSGRCVRLDATSTPAKRTGVEPGSEFSINAQPRSKLDGMPTGGSVVATLVNAAAVEPSGTKVPADAEFTYTAPSEASQRGGVELEARSKRGVGKASLTFDTGGGYVASGGGNGVTITGSVADITQPFTLDGTLDGGSIVLTYLPDTEDGRSGTMSYVGSGSGFTLHGEGTYVITGDDGGPLTLTQDNVGCVNDACAGGVEVITLTPVE
jgi:hypothetical protein